MNFKQSAYFCKSNNYLGHMNICCHFSFDTVHNWNYYQNYTHTLRHFNVHVWYIVITDVWFIKYLVCSRRNFSLYLTTIKQNPAAELYEVDRQTDRHPDWRRLGQLILISPIRYSAPVGRFGNFPCPDPLTCFCTPDFRGLELARLYRRLRPLPFALFLTEKYTRSRSQMFVGEFLYLQ